MVKSTVFTIVLCVAAMQTYAGESFIKKGLLSAQATLAPAFMIDHPNRLMYHADLEYYVERKVSIRSDVYIPIVNLKGGRDFKHYYALFFGAAYHEPIGNLDIFMSLQPGIAYIQSNEVFLNDSEFQMREAKGKVVPMISVGAGINYYIHKNFHFLGKLAFNRGTYSGGTTPYVINEFIISAGLGWNIQTIRR